MAEKVVLTIVCLMILLTVGLWLPWSLKGILGTGLLLVFWGAISKAVMG